MSLYPPHCAKRELADSTIIGCPDPVSGIVGNANLWWKLCQREPLESIDLEGMSAWYMYMYVDNVISWYIVTKSRNKLSRARKIL